MTFNGIKKQKIAILKAHIGSKILASISAQDSSEACTAQTASDSESDFVERSIGSVTSASIESSDSSDFSEGRYAVSEATTEASSRYGRKQTRVQRDNFVSWARIDF